MGGIEELSKAMAAGPESGRQFILGRVVRMDSDDDVSKANTVSVMTFDGTLYRDVLLTYDSRYVRHFPDTPFDDQTLGSLVIVGFLNANQQRPFILKYVEDSMLPVPQEPKNFVSWSNGDFKFSSDGYGNTSIVFENEIQCLSVQMPLEGAQFEFVSNGETKFIIRSFSFETVDFKLDSVNIDEKSETKNVETENFTHTVTEKFDETIKEKTLKIDEKYDEEIKEMKQKIEKLESEIDELKASLKKAEIKIEQGLKLEANEINAKANSKAVLDCKNINLSGVAPSDAPVLFNQLNILMTQLCTALSTLTVVCSAPGSPSSPPVNMAIFQSIQGSLSMLKSKFIKID